MTTADTGGKYLVHEYESRKAGRSEEAQPVIHTEIYYFSLEALSHLRQRGIPSGLEDVSYFSYFCGEIGAVLDDYIRPDGTHIPASQVIYKATSRIASVCSFNKGSPISTDRLPFEDREYNERGYLECLTRCGDGDESDPVQKWPREIKVFSGGSRIGSVSYAGKLGCPEAYIPAALDALFAELERAGLAGIQKAPDFVDPDIPDEDLIHAHDFIRPVPAAPGEMVSPRTPAEQAFDFTGPYPGMGD